MGTLLLFLTRKMIGITDQRANRLRRLSRCDLWLPSQDTNDQNEEGNGLESVFIAIESCFVIGALLGFNLAWVGTDLAMGLDFRYWRALFTECLAFVACALAVRQGRPGAQDEAEDCDEPDDFAKPLLSA
jgi:hypothetical protein